MLLFVGYFSKVKNRWFCNFTLFTCVNRHREMTSHSVVHFGTLLFCDDLHIWPPCAVSKRGINEALQFVERISRLSLFLAKTYFDTLVYCFVWDV